MKVAALLSAGLWSASALAGAIETTGSKCKCFPGDSCWPSSREWRNLNSTVGGRLIATVPLGEACHGDKYDSFKCQQLRDSWQSPGLHMDNSASIMAPFFANQSCDPFTPQSTPCTLGNYVRYAVEVETVADVQNTIAFAKKHNIRFVIRNTGHDYLGRSTGAGAISVWTHKLKNIKFINYKDKYYQGTAVKLGAGVQGFEALEAGLKVGQVFVGGECPTVGVAGGYTQGGGHSALSTSFGLSADNALEWEVVLADGRFVKASRTQNQDLYWALSGGGGGNYGVVTSLTIKTFPDKRIGAATLSFFSYNNPTETFYSAIDAFHDALPDMVSAGSMVVYYFTSSFFMISPLTAYDKTADEVAQIMAPFLAKLDSLNVTYTSGVSESATYREHYDRYFGPLPVGNIQVGIAQYGARLIPKGAIQQNATAISMASRYIAEQGATFIGVGTDVSEFGKKGINSVLPAWRKALVHATLTTEWSFDPAHWNKMLDNQKLMTEKIMPVIEAATPGSGAYMNEADFQQPRFQQEFYGSNYKNLQCIKKRYDPSGFFYATKAVGSEAWEVRNDGRMCKAW